MEIFVNGKAKNVPDGVNAVCLVELLELTGRRIAMELNLEIVPRSEFENVVLRSGDRVEIVHAIGGG